MTTSSVKVIAQTLESIVGKAGVIPYQEWSISQQEQVARAVHPNTKIDCVVYPGTQAELAQVVTCAHKNQWRMLPWGRGSKLSWGGLPQGINLIISTERLDRLIDHAAGDLTVTVEAGMRFSQLQAILAKENQFLALDPAYDAEATIGGIIATAAAGSLRHRYGGVRDMCLGISFVRTDGQIVKAGGQVVKNVAGYDLMKLFTGSFGTLGIISQVTLRLYPLPEASKTVLLTGSAEAIAQAKTALLSSTLTPTAADLISAQMLNGSDRHTLGLAVRFQSLQESINQQAARLLEMAQALGVKQKTFLEAEEVNFWSQVHAKFWQPKSEDDTPIVCKIGVLPSNAIAGLIEMERLSYQQKLPCISLIHTASGLGVLRLDSAGDAQAVLGLRFLWEQAGGFLTVLEAPVTLKQQLDIWGYGGNALELMRKIKQQFDPQNLLSPNRFVGGI